jgi:transposase
VKPFALGRRNWLFAGSEVGGRTASILFSFATICKALKLDPFGYLRDVLHRGCTHPARRVAELLPDRWRALGSVPSSARAE